MSIDNIRPKTGYVIIEDIDLSTQKDGDIFLPETVNGKPIESRIVSINEADDTTVKVGDVVLTAKGGADLEEDGKNYRIIYLEDIYAEVLN